MNLNLDLYVTQTQMDITVIVCTYNRSGLLRTALESMAASEVPGGIAWEILVADNNSKDETRAVVEELIRSHPNRFRYVFERQQGKSNALNAAVTAATGDVLVFADDDVEVDSQWLYRLSAPILSGKWTGSGGRVIAQWGNTVAPRWLDPKGWLIVGPLVHFEPNLPAGPLNETPIGTNMAFRKPVFARYGGFRTDLGPRPGSEIRNEDSEFARRLLQAGEPLYYEPSAIVYHPVPDNRLTKDYFLAWWRAKGRSEVRESAILSDMRWRVCGVPLYLLRRLSRWVVQWMLTLDTKRRFDRKVRVWKLRGEIAESRKISTEPRVQSQSSAVPARNRH